jgi:RNA recognition motif-containing protein
LTNDQILRAIYITNISENATLKNVSDFFGFCGEIEKIVQSRDPELPDKQFAVVVFEQDTAYQAALLLGSPNIVDSQIHVFPYCELVHILPPGRP